VEIYIWRNSFWCDGESGGDSGKDSDMATNGTSIAAEQRFDDEIPGIQMDQGHPVDPVDKPSAGWRTPYGLVPDAAYPRSTGGADPAETAVDFALASLVDRIAFDIARGLVTAMKELENHIATETRKVGDTVERRLNAFETSLRELSAFVREQRSNNVAVQDQLQQLTAADASLRETDARLAAGLDTLRAEAREFSSFVEQQIDTGTASLRESDARQWSELETLRTETKAFSSSVSERIDVTVAALREADERQATDLAALHVETRAATGSITERIDTVCSEVGVLQEDVAAINVTFPSFSSRIDAIVERLDRQADAVRLLHTTYSQREAELEQLVDGLARLRAFPKPLPTNGL
jgi:hypothetical protein